MIVENTDIKTDRRKVKKGLVISNKMDKTVVVLVVTLCRHAKYHKIVQRKKKYYAHDPLNSIEVGKTVSIMETRPLSKLKCWRVIY